MAKGSKSPFAPPPFVTSDIRTARSIRQRDTDAAGVAARAGLVRRLQETVAEAHGAPPAPPTCGTKGCKRPARYRFTLPNGRTMLCCARKRHVRAWAACVGGAFLPERVRVPLARLSAAVLP